MRTIISQVSQGFAAYGQAISFILKHKLAAYFLVPLLLMVLVFVGGAALVNQVAESLEAWLWGILDVEQWTFPYAEYVVGTFSFII